MDRLLVMSVAIVIVFVLFVIDQYVLYNGVIKLRTIEERIKRLEKR